MIRGVSAHVQSSCYVNCVNISLDRLERTVYLLFVQVLEVSIVALTCWLMLQLHAIWRQTNVCIIISSVCFSSVGFGLMMASFKLFCMTLYYSFVLHRIIDRATGH